MNSIFRVVTDSGSHYYVCDSSGGETYPAKLAGRFYQLPPYDRPAVGDWVQGRLEPGNWVFIEERKERQNAIERRLSKSEVQTLAVNVDLLLVLCSLNEDFNLNRLDRYLTLAHQAGIPVLIGLSKADLCADLEGTLNEVVTRFPLQEVLAFSVQTEENMQVLKSRLGEVSGQGGTLAIVGSSGVGKSTLSNWLLGGERMKVSEIREDDGRGRHTTTHRSLLPLSDGGWLMDTPGLRGINPEFSSGDEVAAHFQDLEELCYRCRFSDCRHESEPGCAVNVALDSGALDFDRWQSFYKLKSEGERQNRMLDPREMQKERNRWKKLHNNVRAKMAFRRRNGYGE